MAHDKVTPIRPGSEPPDPFDSLYDRMQAQLDTLCCVHAVLAADTDVDRSEDLSAARGVLRRSLRELDRVHTDLATWHMAQAQQA